MSRDVLCAEPQTATDVVDLLSNVCVKAYMCATAGALGPQYSDNIGYNGF